MRSGVADPLQAGATALVAMIIVVALLSHAMTATMAAMAATAHHPLAVHPAVFLQTKCMGLHAVVMAAKLIPTMAEFVGVEATRNPTLPMDTSVLRGGRHLRLEAMGVVMGRGLRQDTGDSSSSLPFLPSIFAF